MVVVQDQGVMIVGVGKSVSYISFIGGMFGFGQIRGTRAPTSQVHDHDHEGRFQATRWAKLTGPTQHEEHSSVITSLGHELKLVAQFFRRNLMGCSRYRQVSESRAGCAVPKNCKNTSPFVVLSAVLRV